MTRTELEAKTQNELYDMIEGAGYQFDASRWAEIDFIKDGQIVATKRRRGKGNANEARVWMIEALLSA